MLSPTELGHSHFIDESCSCYCRLLYVPRLNSRWLFPKRLRPWFLLLVHSRATYPELPQTKQVTVLSSSTLFTIMTTPTWGSLAGNYFHGLCRRIVPSLVLPPDRFEVVNLWFHLLYFRDNLLSPVWTWVPGSLFPSLLRNFASVQFSPFLVFICQFCGSFILLWS